MVLRVGAILGAVAVLVAAVVAAFLAFLFYSLGCDGAPCNDSGLAMLQLALAICGLLPAAHTVREASRGRGRETASAFAMTVVVYLAWWAVFPDV